MKLEKVLDCLNSLEKNAFLKIIDGIISDNPKNARDIDKILSDKSKELKEQDSINISKIFTLIEGEFVELIRQETANITSQLNTLSEIIIRDGNCIMSRDWFNKLYDKQLSDLNKKNEHFKKSLENDGLKINEERRRDYKIYQSCLKTAYFNDFDLNQDPKITSDEQSLLFTLSQSLELSQEEIKLINHTILPINKLSIDEAISNLKNIGVVFYSRKNGAVYVADEIVTILRKVKGKEIADKFFRRILKLIKEPQINLVCRKHSIDWRLSLDKKIDEIIKSGISFSGILMRDIYKQNTKALEKKKIINDLYEKGLKLGSPLKGLTAEEKIKNIVKYFEEVEQDDKIGISMDGYEKLLVEISEKIPNFKKKVMDLFELENESMIKKTNLLDYNIKPRDILEIFDEKLLENFCKSSKIKTRGNLVQNILDAYKDAENLYLENYENIGFRKLNILKENGIQIKESELGIKFENLTKTIFTKLGFNVDETLRKHLNTKKDKIDIVINIDNQKLILIECKTIKENGYNKFSSVARQLNSYINLAINKNYSVIKSLLIAPDFSSDFIKDCELDYNLNLSLIKASSLIAILDGFKDSNREQLPHNLLMRDVLIQENRILSAISK